MMRSKTKSFRLRCISTSILVLALASLAAPASPTPASLTLASPEDGAPPSPKVGGSLPTADLVNSIRSARIAHLNDDHGREHSVLSTAYEAYPEQVLVLEALLGYYGGHEGSAETAAAEKLRRQLVVELSDPSAELAISTLIPLARIAEDHPQVLEALANYFERRSRLVETADPQVSKMAVAVAESLDRPALVETYLLQLLEQEPDFETRWHLVQHYRKMERYEDSAKILAAWLEEESMLFLRTAYIRELSRLGRLEDLEGQIGLLARDLGLTKEPASPGPGEPSEMGSDRVYALRSLNNALHGAAWLLRDAGLDEDAERLFRYALSHDPFDTDTQNVLIYLYGSAEELQALQDAQQERWTEEEDPRSLFDEGTVRLTAGDSAAALELLARAAPGLPDLEAAWYNLGMAAYREESWETVAEAFGKAASLDPSRAQTFFYRGLALEKLGRCGEAVSDLEQALTLDPSRSIAHYYLASCYRKLGNAAKASEHARLYEEKRG